MKIRLLSLLILSTLTSTTALNVTAQTVRVCCGTGHNGTRAYKEVYEYDYVEKKPEFPGGDDLLVSYINKHRQYPEKAYREGIEGRVMCSFVVNADGTVSNVSVLKGVEESLNKEAVRIISAMPDWHPGTLGGHKVPVRVVWAVPFRR